MSNVPLMFQPLVKYVDFQGRARRSEFWLWVLFRIIVGAVTGTLSMTLMFSGMNFQNPDPSQFMARYFQVMPLFQLINLALLLPTLAVAVRRLHDINRSGWWLIMPIAVAIVGFVLFIIMFGTQIFSMAGGFDHMTEEQSINFAFGMFGSLFLCIFLPILISQIVMLVFYCTDGTPTANRFGADPKGRGVIDTPEVMF
ncbi:Inner membrane protein YhaI [Asticcacaulis sp. MM231]|uniref:DUF805 domain-containing protein n=1 Tax=Asticcacaulis sp. MM231 TaxID=3157666 RepID=UPI0032D5AB48